MADSFKRLAAALFAALSLAACSKDLPEPSSPTTPAGPYTFLIGGEDTRAILGQDDRGRFAQWESGDRIGTLVTSGGTTESGYANVYPGQPSSFRLYHVGGFAAGDVVRAYYPYTSATSSLNNVQMSIPAVQAQNGEVFDLDAMPLVAMPYEIAEPVTDNFNPVGEIYFANLAAIAEFKVFSTNGAYAGETINSIKFEGSSPLAGSFSIDLSGTDFSNPETLVIDGYSDSAITTVLDPGCNVPSSQSSAVSVMMVLAPGTYNGTVTVTTDAAVYRYPLKSSQTFKRSVIRSFDVNLGTCTDRQSNAVAITVTKTVKQMLAASGVSSPVDGQKYEELVLDDVVSVESGGGGNNGKYYNTGTSWRLYPVSYGNLKIKVAPGYDLQSVTLTYTKETGTSSGQTVTPTFDGPNSGSAYPVTGTGVVFYVNGAAGHIRVTKISVTYIESGRTPQRPFLDCTEVPSVSIIRNISGNESYGVDDLGTGQWHEFDMQDANRRIITHTFYYNGKMRRNYTTMVDKTLRCPLWVAYPLHGTAYKDNDIGRVGGFDEKRSYDPAIPAGWQSSGSTKNSDNTSSGFSRGHMCASEDRQVTVAANYQTFYYSNQVPQWQNGFNSGVWSALESAVQTKGQSLTGRDTLYVVSGGIYDSVANYPSNDGGNVARPSKMYKLLMLCSFNSSGTITAASGAAYIFTNESHTGSQYYNSSFQTTIDAVEQQTGFDFFANVPASLQTEAESSFHSIL
ncbi:MAG: DNA/RNA non-specific endonuclease [Bacteroidales bacterium]|nr:DNA/RNA non-specific endonuclease [Bacteroidales bacterium]